MGRGSGAEVQDSFALEAALRQRPLKVLIEVRRVPGEVRDVGRRIRGLPTRSLAETRSTMESVR